MPHQAPVERGISIQQLTYFLSAINQGSLSAAAAVHYMAQPSLSEQIRRLERRLGVTLFIRTNRKLVLTEAGRALIPHAQSVLAAARAAEESMIPQKQLSGGAMTLGTFNSSRDLFHAELAERFHERHPNVGLRLVESSSVHIADHVREGRIEVGIVVLPVVDRELTVEPLDWKAESVYVSADPERTVKPVTIKALAEAPLVMRETLWGDTDPVRSRIDLMAQKAGLSVAPLLEVSSTASALELAARGVGDTVGMRALLDTVRTSGPLHWAHLEPRVHEQFGVIRRRGATLSPAAAKVVELVRQIISELPGA